MYGNWRCDTFLADYWRRDRSHYCRIKIVEELAGSFRRRIIKPVAPGFVRQENNTPFFVSGLVKLTHERVIIGVDREQGKLSQSEPSSLVR